MASNNQLLRTAQNDIKAGNSAAAIKQLKQAVNNDPRDHRPWLMLARIAPNDKARAQCIDKAAKLAPDDPIVLKAQAWMANRLQEKQSAKPAVAKTAAVATAAAQQAPLPPPQPQQVEEDPLKSLRAKSQAEPIEAEETTSSSRRRVWLWGAAAVCILLLILMFGWTMRPAILAQESAVAAVDPSPTPLPAETTVAQVTNNDAIIVSAEASELEAEATATATAVIITASPTPAPTEPPLRSKEIVARVSSDQSVERAPWTPTPTPTSTPSPTPSPVPTYVSEGGTLFKPQVGANEKWIDVDLTAQTLRAFEGDTLVYETLISSGRAPYYTVTGQFRIYLRYESQTMDGRYLGFDYVTPGVPHVQYFYKDFALHGAFWHNNFGNPESHGCVNLSLPDAEWLYQWAEYGTLVNVHY